MAKVVFPDHFLHITEDVRELESHATSYRELVEELCQRWPQLTTVLDTSAVAIDGQIYQDAWLEPIATDAEVFFMTRIEGG